MTCYRALFPGGTSSPVPFLLAGPAFAREATEGTPHAVRTLYSPTLGTQSNMHMHFIGMDPEPAHANLEHYWNTAPNHLPPQIALQYAMAAAGRLRQRHENEDYRRRSSSFTAFEVRAGRGVVCRR